MARSRQTQQPQSTASLMRWGMGLLSLVASAAFGVERFPPPDFSGGYQLPEMVNPLPRAEWWAWLDVALLAGALALMSYLTLRRRSRRGVFLLMLASLVYFGFIRHGCVCAVGAIQNVALAIGNTGYALPLTVAAFFLLPLVFALFAGRVFCAGVCPLGALQDLVLLRPLNVPAGVAHALGLLPYVYLGLAVLLAATGSAFLICQYDPFVAVFRLSGQVEMVLFSGLILLICAFVGRAYCRFLCPYGVLQRWLAPLARWRVTITPKACVQCRLCEESCPFGAIRYPTPPATAEERQAGKGRLALLLVLLPVLIVLGGWLGQRGSGTLAQMHPTVRLAARLWQEDKQQVTGYTDPTTAFRQRGEPNEAAYREAALIRRRFHTGSTAFGAWIGLVIGAKLIALSVRRRREDYEADPADCLACARCYTSCPVEHERLKGPGKETAEEPVGVG